MSLRSAPALLFVGYLMVACGGGTPEPKIADDSVETDDSGSDEKSGMAISSEVGGLNEDRVNSSFEHAVDDLQKCLNKGASRIEFIGGSVSFFVEVASDGEVGHTHLEQSTLGDRKTEKCMLSALKKQDWPKPVGGRVGHARKSFDFDPPSDARPPTDWDPENVQKELEKKASEIAECKGNRSGSFNATMYVDTDGKALGVGVAPPDAEGESAVDCLVDLLEGLTYPSPGSWPAKVSFSL